MTSYPYLPFKNPPGYYDISVTPSGSDIKFVRVPEQEKEDPMNPIITEMNAIKKMLLEKNKKYGNSALEPIRIFSQAAADEQLRVRIDDKLSRVLSGQKDNQEDTIQDLIGYLVLLQVARHA